MANEFSMGFIWNVFNVLVGICLIATSFYPFIIPSVWRILTGILVIWLAVTHKFCENYALDWFPFWNNFLFIGLLFMALGCGVFEANYANEFFYGLMQMFIFMIGSLYVIFWLLNRFANVGIPEFVPFIGDDASGANANANAPKEQKRPQNVPNVSGGPSAGRPAGPPPPPAAASAPRPSGGPPPPPQP